MRIITRSLVPLSILALVGCQTSRPMDPAPSMVALAATPAPGHPSESPATLPALPRSSAFEMPGTTIEAIGLVTDTFDKLGFINDSPGKQGGQPQVESSDVFSARALVATAEGQHVRVDCRWLGEGRTEVRVSSDLEESRHAYVFQLVRTAVTQGPQKPPGVVNGNLFNNTNGN